MKDSEVIGRFKELQKDIENIKKFLNAVYGDINRLNVISNGNKMVIQKFSEYEEAWKEVKKELQEKEEKFQKEKEQEDIIVD